MPNSSAQNFSFGVVILAAGASRRMGTQKLLLPWGETSVLGHLLRQWDISGAAQIGVVCARDAYQIHAEFERISPATSSSLIFNPAPELGMFSSIQCAANWTGWNVDLTHWIVTLGDQPQLQSETLRALLNFSAANPEKICQPLRRGRRKHPVSIPKHLFTRLKDSPAADLKHFLASFENELAGFESDDAGLDHDLDTPEDYARLKPASGPA